MARVTSSSDRAKRQARSNAVVRSSQGRPNRQRASTAQTTSSENRPNNGGRRVTTDAGRPSRTLPPRGGTSAGSPKAVAQRLTTKATQKASQDITTLRALADNMRRNQARDARQIPADKSPKVRYVPPGGANAKPQGALPPASGPSRREAAQSRADRAAAGSRGSEVRTGQPGRGGALVSQRGPSVDRRQPRLGADTRGRGVRIGNSSQPWGEQPTRQVQVRDVTGRPQLTGRNQASLPQGRPTRMETAQAKAANAAAGTRGEGVRTGQPAGAANRMYGAGRVNAAVDRALRQGNAGRVAGRAGLAGLALGAIQAGLAATNTGWGANVRRYMQEEQDFKDGIIRRWTGGNSDQRRGNPPAQTGRSGRGGSSQDLPLRGKAGPAVPSRLLRLAQQQGDDRPTPSQPSRSTRSGASGSGSTGSYRPAAPGTPRSSQRTAAAAPSPQSSGSSSSGSGARTWDQFNPDRGTQFTNNPLIRKDDWLMGKLKERANAQNDQTGQAASKVGSKFSTESNSATEGLKIDEKAKAGGDAAAKEYNKLTEEQKKRLRERQQAN